MIQRRKIIIGTLGAAAAATAIGGSAPIAASAGTTAAAGREEKTSLPPAPVKLTVSPASGSVSPATPVVVTAENGTVQSVAVTTGGAKVAGEVQPDGTW